MDILKRSKVAFAIFDICKNYLKSSLCSRFLGLMNCDVFKSIVKIIVFLSFIFCLDIDNSRAGENFSEEYYDMLLTEDDYYNHRIYDIEKTTDGGVVAVGRAGTDDRDSYMWYSAGALIVKYDKNGNREWAETFYGSQTEYFYSVVETSDKGFVAVGYTSSPESYTYEFTHYGGDDGLIVKYDRDGRFEWCNTFGGLNSDYFYSVLETFEGNIVAIGASNSFDAGFDNWDWSYYKESVIVVYDSEGNQIGLNSFNGSKYDYLKAAILTSSGEIIVIGYSNTESYAYNGGYDALIVKYDAYGNFINMVSFGGSDDDYFTDVEETSDGGFIAVGYSDSSNAGFNKLREVDAIMVKYDRNFAVEWVRNFGDFSENKLNSVSVTPKGDIVAVGASAGKNSEGLIVKVSSKGELLWYETWFDANASDIASVYAYNEKEFYISNIVDSTIGNFKYGTIIIKCTELTEEEKVNYAIENAKTNPSMRNIRRARRVINGLEESIEKDQLQLMLDELVVNDIELIPETISSNLDVFITSVNNISLSLVSSNVSFTDFSGLEDVYKADALELNISSSLNYNIVSSLVGDIVSSNGNILDKSILNLKSSKDTSYKDYSNLNTITLFTNQTAGNNKSHNIDIMLKGNVAHTADVYKAILKIMVEQV